MIKIFNSKLLNKRLKTTKNYLLKKDFWGRAELFSYLVLIIASFLPKFKDDESEAKKYEQ